MLESINAHFTENIQTQIAAADTLAEPIAKAAIMLVQALLNGNKILCCGHGSSASNAQHFASCLLNRFETERPSLPAFALSADNVAVAAIGSDHNQEEIFSKQVRAFGQDADVLLAISSSGNSKDIIKAMEAAVNRNMTIVALTGNDGGEMAGLLGQQDVEIRVPSERNARIQEGHMVILHTLCCLIDQNLFPTHGE